MCHSPLGARHILSCPPSVAVTLAPCDQGQGHLVLPIWKFFFFWSTISQVQETQNDQEIVIASGKVKSHNSMIHNKYIFGISPCFCQLNALAIS